MIPTREQKKIIDCETNAVVIAQPGSGKTYTLSKKIIDILDELPEYMGVIAISYTRKASRELEKRCLQGGTNKKGAFFGTMDKFYISEIVLPFGRHIFGKPKKELEILDRTNPIIQESINLEQFIDLEDLNKYFHENIEKLESLYLKSYVLLESVSVLSLYILDHSTACTNYLKARYSHIIIDEYQDCGKEQHDVFMVLKNLGLIAVAVGDVNQSIFGFANKSPEFLIELAQNTDFKSFYLTKNHRCHPSIINYSMKLIAKDFTDFISTKEKRVYSKTIEGKEEDIANWLNSAIKQSMSQFNVENNNEVGILVRNNRTGSIIDKNLSIAHKYFDGTPFDLDSSLWGNIFDSILNFTFSNKSTKYELVESYLDIDLQIDRAKQVMRLLSKIESIKSSDNKTNVIDDFIKIAQIIHPKAENKKAQDTLKMILGNPDILDKFKPAESNEVQVMTLHKSKGLEFKIVFHLDLYKYIFPSEYNRKYTSPIQDLNLHYVGITRAEECCVLCTSTQRQNGNGRILDGVKSIFLEINRLLPLRDLFMY